MSRNGGLMMSHDHFLEEAIREAEKALREDELPVGAIAVLRDRIIGRGYRKKYTNTRLDHAEMIALRQAIDDVDTKEMREVAIYTTLEPCVMCFGAMLNCYVKKVVFPLADPFGGAAGLNQDMLPERHHCHVLQVVGPESGEIGSEVKVAVEEMFYSYFRATENSFWRGEHDNPFVRAILDQPRTVR